MKNRNRKAFASFDAMVAVVILGAVVLGLYELKKKEKMNNTYAEKRLFLQKFDDATLQSFRDIINISNKYNHNFGDNDTQWGWNKLSNVSPYPTLSTVGGTPYLTYELDNSIISVKEQIIGHYSGICYDWSDKVGASDEIHLYCPLLKDIKYDLSDGSTDLTSPFTKGQPLNPNIDVILKMTYLHYDGLKTSSIDEEYHISYTSVFEERKNISAQKMMTIRDILEGYATDTKLKELANVENSDGSGGLNSADDEMIPWHWKSYGDKKSSMDSTFCNKSAGGSTCDNLNSNDIWRSGTNIKRGLIAKRIANNFFNGDTSMFVDGFGNGIYIHPNGNDCSGDLSSCRINSPTLPQDDYINIGNPPYTSIVYIDSYKDVSSTPNDVFGRLITTY